MISEHAFREPVGTEPFGRAADMPDAKEPTSRATPPRGEYSDSRTLLARAPDSPTALRHATAQPVSPSNSVTYIGFRTVDTTAAVIVSSAGCDSSHTQSRPTRALRQRTPHPLFNASALESDSERFAMC